MRAPTIAIESPAPQLTGVPPLSTLPTRAEVRAAIPDRCFERSTLRSFGYLLFSAAVVGALVASAIAFVPVSWAWTPVWMLYAIATGTAATGLWVIAHECGHGAFSKYGWVQDTVGYVLHTALLVPYFSWQRSHSVHHAKTNHLDEGETHVPKRVTDSSGLAALRRKGRLGKNAYTLITLVSTLLFGWPLYLLLGATAGPARSRANHFWPVAPFRSELFPKRWVAKVWASTAGIVVVLGLLAWAAVTWGVASVIVLYVGPLLVVNAWLVLYTWLQHTDVDVPHFADDEWKWLLGAFQTIDRPYPKVVDVLHHGIGTTHVAHHIDHRIPHYHAREATEAIKATFPEWYRYNPTPIAKAMWQVAGDCVVVDQVAPEDGWTFEAAESARAS